MGAASHEKFFKLLFYLCFEILAPYIPKTFLWYPPLPMSLAPNPATAKSACMRKLKSLCYYICVQANFFDIADKTT